MRFTKMFVQNYKIFMDIKKNTVSVNLNNFIVSLLKYI